MKKALFWAVLMVAVNACEPAAADGQFWSRDKTTNALIVSSNLLLVIDWAQTRYGTDRPGQFEESGIAEHFTGTHPTTGAVNRYNVSALVLLNVLGYYLPERATIFGQPWNPKKTLYFGATAVEGVTVYNNYQAGVKLQF